MPTRARTESTTERVLRLLTLLQQRPVWTGPELADRLGVTTRSIRRDVERLRALGYPVNAAHGVGGGYQLGAGKALPPLLLDDEEAIATAVSLRLAAGGSVAGASEAAVRTLAKLDQVLPARLRAQVRTLHDAIATLPGVRTEVDAEVLAQLATATRDRLRVEFAYSAHDGTDTERRVEPYQLVATGRRWYLMAYDLDRDDWRTFRLDRVRDLHVSTLRYQPREHPEPTQFVQQAISAAPYTHIVRARVQADVETVAGWINPVAARVEPIDEHTCLFISGHNDPNELAIDLVRLGVDFEVLEPDEVRDAVARLGERCLAAAAPSVGR